MTKSESGKTRPSIKDWSTRDLLVMAAISIVMGLVLVGVNYLGAALLAISPVLASVLAGLYFVPGIMVMLIVRRPGANILTRIIVNLAMLPFTPFGWGPLLLEPVLFGGSAELPFLIMRYKDYRMRVAMIAGAAAALMSFLMMLAFGLLSGLSAGLTIVTLASFLASGVLFGGILSTLLVRAIAKSGVLNSFAIAQRDEAQVD